jgi:hypothetical protein
MDGENRPGGDEKERLRIDDVTRLKYPWTNVVP